MKQFNSVNEKLWDSQLERSKPATKNSTRVTFILSINMTGNDEATFANKLSLLDGQFTNIRKHFENNSVINVKLSKRQVANIVQSFRFLDTLLEKLLEIRLSIAKTLLTPRVKTIFIPLR